MKEEKKKLIEERKKFVEKIMKEHESDINNSFKKSKYYQSFHGLNFVKKVKKLSKERKKSILFTDLDTVSAVKEICGGNGPGTNMHLPYVDGKVALLDFASYKKPGGGFINGSKAQEEDICSKSTLYPILKLFEPIYKRRKGNKGEYGDDLLYIPEVYFVKNPELGDFYSSFYADVIVSAAPNAKILREHCDERYINRILFNRIENIFKVAIDNNIDCLILGAYGTGVFDNNIMVVATAFKEYCDMYHGYFEKIIFAIPDKKKLDVFRQVFCIYD